MNHHQYRSVFHRARGTRRLLTACAVLVAGLLAQTAAAASAEPDSPQVLARQATGDFASGRFEEAVKRWDTAAAAYAESGDTKGQIDALLGKGIA